MSSKPSQATKVEEQKSAKKTNRKSNAASAKKSAANKNKDMKEEKKFEHPPPKRPGSAWLFFNTEFGKKFKEDGGEQKDAFGAASTKW